MLANGMEVTLQTEPHLLAGTVNPTVGKRNVTLPIDNGLNLVEWRQRKEQARGQVTVFGRRLRVSTAAALDALPGGGGSPRNTMGQRVGLGCARLRFAGSRLTLAPQFDRGQQAVASVTLGGTPVCSRFPRGVKPTRAALYIKLRRFSGDVDASKMNVGTVRQPCGGLR